MYLDVLICPVIVANRDILDSAATDLTNPVLTRADGYLTIESNYVLTRFDFASLSYVGEYLGILRNTALTFASLPRLSQVQGAIYMCDNAPSFVIPNHASGTAAPPGLTSVLYKGTDNCFFQEGSVTCHDVACP